MQAIKRWLNALDLPGDAIGGEMRIAAQGNREISVAGVLAVKEYTVHQLRMQVVGGALIIWGNRLEIREIGGGVACVGGEIERVDFAMDAQGTQKEGK